MADTNDLIIRMEQLIKNNEMMIQYIAKKFTEFEEFLYDKGMVLAFPLEKDEEEENKDI